MTPTRSADLYTPAATSCHVAGLVFALLVREIAVPITQHGGPGEFAPRGDRSRDNSSRHPSRNVERPGSRADWYPAPIT